MKFTPEPCVRSSNRSERTGSAGPSIAGWTRQQPDREASPSGTRKEIRRPQVSPNGVGQRRINGALLDELCRGSFRNAGSRKRLARRFVMKVALQGTLEPADSL